MDTWSEISLGLRHHADTNRMLKRLANGGDETPLRTLAKYIEPAQYYARHWQKWISTPNKGDLYNQYERLNRFADALPVESLAAYEMQDLVTAFALGDKAALDALARHYDTVKLAAQQAKPIFAKNIASVETVPVTEAAVQLAELGLELIDAAKQGRPITQNAAERYQRIINKNAVIIDETIVAIVLPTQQLLYTLKGSAILAPSVSPDGAIGTVSLPADPIIMLSPPPPKKNLCRRNLVVTQSTKSVARPLSFTRRVCH